MFIVMFHVDFQLDLYPEIVSFRILLISFQGPSLAKLVGHRHSRCNGKEYGYLSLISLWYGKIVLQFILNHAISKASIKVVEVQFFLSK